MFLTIRKDTHKVSVSGIEQPESDVMQLTEEHLAIKIPGHTYRYVGGGTTYVGAEIHVYEIEEQTDLGEIIRIKAERILQFPIKKPKK